MHGDMPWRSQEKISSWENKMKQSGCTINAIQPLYMYKRPNGQLLFSLLDADIVTPENTKLPNIIFIRGHACIIVTLVKNSDNGQTRFLMIKQRRIASGELHLEFPAGMLDELADNPLQRAYQEFIEETGLAISRDSLFSLTENPLYSSPGASDEAIYYFGCIIELDETSFHQLEGRYTGKKTEHEHIQVTLKTRKEAEQETLSLQARLGFFLFQEYCQKNNIQIESSGLSR